MAVADDPAEIGLLLYPGVQLAAVYGLSDVFEVANRIVGENRRAAPAGLRVSHWQIDTATATIGKVLDTHPQLRSRPAVIVVPPRLVGPVERETAACLARWLVERHRAGSILCSICAGIFLLAETGLLAGRSVATHWSHRGTLAQLFPEIRLDADGIVVDDGDIITAGGPMAWTDVGLKLVDRLLGHASMSETARFLSHDPAGSEHHPEGGFSPSFRHGDEAIRRVQHWIQARKARDVTLSAMATCAGLGQRTFLRRFRKATGFRPTEYCQHVRVARARDLLGSTGRTVAQVALAVGYEDPAAFRKVFERVAGLSPREYRSRLSAPARVRASATTADMGTPAGC